MSESHHRAPSSVPWNRRRVLQAGALAALSALASPSLANDELEQPPTTPQEALERLYEGNRRFASGQPLSVHQDLNRVKAIATRQTPFAAFLGCADSRVPIEFVFDQGFGDLFVTRIAGNIASSENIGIQKPEELSRRHGVGGVPFFIFNEKVALSGAQASETFIEAFRQAIE
jgi:hypothetical protein